MGREIETMMAVGLVEQDWELEGCEETGSGMGKVKTGTRRTRMD